MIKLKDKNFNTVWVNENKINYITIEFPNCTDENGEYLEYTLHFDEQILVVRADEKFKNILGENNE